MKKIVKLKYLAKLKNLAFSRVFFLWRIIHLLERIIYCGSSSVHNLVRIFLSAINLVRILTV